LKKCSHQLPTLILHNSGYDFHSVVEPVIPGKVNQRSCGTALDIVSPEDHCG
jgi:hypothetical protein